MQIHLYIQMTKIYFLSNTVQVKTIKGIQRNRQDGHSKKKILIWLPFFSFFLLELPFFQNQANNNGKHNITANTFKNKQNNREGNTYCEFQDIWSTAYFLNMEGIFTL